MNKEEFRRQLEPLLFIEYTTKDPAERERVVTERKRIEREYKKTLFADMQKSTKTR